MLLDFYKEMEIEFQDDKYFDADFSDDEQNNS
jgi:hypothetical protein